MTEADANGDNAFAVIDKVRKETGKLFASERQELDTLLNDVGLIMTDYLSMDWGDKTLTPIRREGKGAEHEFCIPLVPGIEVTGRLDLIARTRDKRRWLTEHKTFSRLPNEDHRWRNLQSNIYIRVGELLGITFDGFAWDYIRSKSPPLPKLLKDGTVSKKRLDTLPSALREFFADHSVPRETRERMLKTASDGMKRTWFIRLLQPIKRKTVEVVWQDFIESAREMVEKGGVLKAKTLDRHCDWCEFEGICRAELTGGDAKYVKAKEYTIREKKEDDHKRIAEPTD